MPDIGFTTVIYSLTTQLGEQVEYSNTLLNAPLPNPTLVTDLYVELTLTASQIKNCGGTEIDIIPAPPAGKFISVVKGVASYKPGIVAFAFDSEIVFKIGSEWIYVIAGTLNFLTAKNMPLVQQGQDAATSTAMKMGTGSGNNSATGDGTLYIKIYYNLETANI